MKKRREPTPWTIGHRPKPPHRSLFPPAAISACNESVAGPRDFISLLEDIGGRVEVIFMTLEQPTI